VRLEITPPDRHLENVELKPVEGSQTFPLSYAGGGDVTVKAIATDSAGATATTQSTTVLQPCTTR
jgi:hypothetical protein